MIIAIIGVVGTLAGALLGFWGANKAVAPDCRGRAS